MAFLFIVSYRSLKHFVRRAFCKYIHVEELSSYEFFKWKLNENGSKHGSADNLFHLVDS